MLASPSRALLVESGIGWDLFLVKVLTSDQENGVWWWVVCFLGVFFFQSGNFNFLILVLIPDKTPVQRVLCPESGFTFTMSW